MFIWYVELENIKIIIQTKLREYLVALGEIVHMSSTLISGLEFK